MLVMDTSSPADAVPQQQAQHNAKRAEQILNGFNFTHRAASFFFGRRLEPALLLAEEPLAPTHEQSQTPERKASHNHGTDNREDLRNEVSQPTLNVGKDRRKTRTRSSTFHLVTIHQTR